MRHRARLNAYEVIVVGAGPAGSSAATFLSRQGIDCLLLDRARFPREKVCGDGLTPQALYWLDKLGCADEALDRTRACIDTCDLHINGRRILTGRFPQNGAYPGFSTLLKRKDLDHLLVRNAMRHGARFLDGCAVTSVRAEAGGAVVETDSRGGKKKYRTRLVIGADGSGSTVSRGMGNAHHAGTKALSMRTYFSGVSTADAQIRIFFDEYLFPGYGWIFTDDRGEANVGVGCVSDRLFKRPLQLRSVFKRFVESSAAPFLRDARQTAPLSGGWAEFSRLQRITFDAMALIGDAANHADPLSGGGIHKAMEDAALVSRIAASALHDGPCSRDALAAYEREWEKRCGVDWQSAELLLAFAKNPSLRALCLFMLDRIGRACREDPVFADFCAGIFCGVVPQRTYLSPMALLSALPVRPSAWLQGKDIGRSLTAAGALAALACLKTGRESVAHPGETARWFVEISKKIASVGVSTVAAAGDELAALFGSGSVSGSGAAGGPFYPLSSFTMEQAYAI